MAKTIYGSVLILSILIGVACGVAVGWTVDPFLVRGLKHTAGMFTVVALMLVCFPLLQGRDE